MKIRQLHINRFGHFTDFDLVFPGEGLQVVFGPNEAGKTTLLEFLRSLLFDFHPRTPYDFGGSGEMAGVATLAMKDGRIVELRRRKGNKDKVSIKLDDRPTDLDDAGWLRMLDRADRGLFESVFAFGLDQLSQGEASLKHESLQSALFGGSLGGTSSPDKVTDELKSQAEALFKKGGSKPAINALLADLKHLAKEIKDRSLRPEKYQQAEEAVAKATDQAKQLHEQVEQLRREHSKIEKRVRAWPKWWDLQQRLGQRSGLSVPENIPSDARQRHQNLAAGLKTLAEDQAKRKQEIDQAEAGLATVKLNPAAVSQRAAIKSCLELRQSFVEAKQDLPERQQERDTMRLQVDRELAELRPGWSHDDLLAFSVDVATRELIERLNDERRARLTARTKLTATREADAANLDLALDEQAELGMPREVTVLAAVLADEAEFVASRKQADGARGELAKLERKLATQCRKLSPPVSAAATAPQELPVPRSETVAEFETGFADLREQLRAASASIEQDESERREIERSLAAALSGHAVPSLEERDAARVRRDAGWDLVRRKFISGEPADDAVRDWVGDSADASLPESYEQAVRQADEIADQIYENANEVAKREALRRQLQTVAARIAQKKERLAELDRRHADLQASWLALWQPCGFQPLAPDAMLGWLQDHEAVCGTVARQDELKEELSRVEERIGSFEQRLRAAGDLPGVDIPHLLALARTSVDEAKGQQRKAIELQKTIRRLEPQLAKHDEKLQALAAGEKAAGGEWRALLSGLNLPADWDTELARTVIDKLKTTRVRLDGIPGQEARIGAIQARIQEFEQRVRSLCETLEPELLRDPPELAIEKLAEQVEQAVESRRKHDELSQKLVEARKQLKALNDQHAKLDAEGSELFALAKAATETEFLEVVLMAEKVSRLDGEIEQIRRELDLIRGGDDRGEFESSLVDSDRAVLESRQRDLAEQLGRQESVKRIADESVGAARKELSQLDGSAGVALLSEELARRRSQLAAEVDRYVPLIYARHLLNAAVSRFERENQPEMIATVSRLLGQMTGGKYVEFDRASGKQGMLVRRADGVERTSAQLSTGTREQLYLAIRLAYVLHYCDRNEPLPIVIDDVLVNFDAARTRRTLAALAGISQTAQVLLFTCHAHMVDMAREAAPGLQPIELPGASG